VTAAGAGTRRVGFFGSFCGGFHVDLEGLEARGGAQVRGERLEAHGEALEARGERIRARGEGLTQLSDKMPATPDSGYSTGLSTPG